MRIYLSVMTLIISLTFTSLSFGASAVGGSGISAAIGTAASEIGQFQTRLGQTNAVISGARSWNSNIQSGADFLDTFTNFDPSDAGMNPNFNEAGMPQVPTNCGLAGTAETNADCQACYEPHYRNLNFVRRIFERLRAIYAATKNYTEKMIAFGDTGANAMGVGGLPWHYEKKGIEDALKKMQGTYRSKYTDLLKTLKKSLDGIAECEAKHYGEQNWYSRYGFMYYTFMEDRYRLAD